MEKTPNQFNIKKGENQMKLGTIVYNNEIYNLDFTTADEIKQILQTVETVKWKNIQLGKQGSKTKENMPC